MVAPPRQRPRRARGHGALAGVAVSAVLGILYAAGVFRTFDLKLLDARFRLRGEEPASDRIALVEIDDATIGAYGRWPIPRDTYALLLNAIEGAGARAVGFDLLFLGEDGTDPRFDALLAQVVSKYDNVVNAIGFSSRGTAPVDAAAVSGSLNILHRHGETAPRVSAPAALGVSLPYPELLKSSGALGHVMVAVDPDGVVRRLPLYVSFQERLYPSLVMRLATLGPHPLPAIRPGRGGILVEGSGDHPAWTIPLDREGTTAIDFAGDRNSFPHAYSMLDVLRWYRSGEEERLRHAFSGRYVLVGNTAVGEVATDVDATPFNPVTPLLFVHANVLNSLLGERFLNRPATVLYVGGLAAAGAALGTLLVGLSLPLAAAAVFLVLIGFAVGDQLLLSGSSLDVPPMAAVLLPPAVYAAMASYRFMFLERFERARGKEIRLAREIQRRLLPSEPPPMEEFDVFGTNLPAQEVGGDYFDWAITGDRGLIVALGDVSGKGISASLLMSHLRASFHAELGNRRSPSEIVASMHQSLYRATEPERFATFFLAQLDPATTELSYCNAGHNPGLLSRGGGVEILGGNGPPLGLLDPAEFTESSVPFGAGDVLVLYSDGITESPRRHGEFGEERLTELVRRLTVGSRSAAGIGNAILEDVRAFSRDEIGADDITVVVVRRRSRPERGP